MNLFAYFRSLLMAVCYPLFLLAMSGAALAGNILLNRRGLDDRMVHNWGRWSNRMFGVVVKARGLENIPTGGCLFVFNHTSFFDVFAMAEVLPGIRFGAKIELFSFPLFGRAMLRLGMLPIDRSNRERVFSVYKDAQARLLKGERFALAPEGTRQDEERLGRFKAGPFVFAINTQAKIVPIVIRGAAPILPKHHFVPNSTVWRREVSLEILPAITAAEYTIDRRQELQEKTRQAMAQKIPS